MVLNLDLVFYFIRKKKKKSILPNYLVSKFRYCAISKLAVPGFRFLSTKISKNNKKKYINVYPEQKYLKNHPEIMGTKRRAKTEVA